MKKRIKRKDLDKAQRGEWHGGRRPFGYRNIEGGKLEIDQAEAALIKDAAQKFLEGTGIRTIVNDWNGRGVRPVSGTKFGPTQVKQILSGPIVAGKRQYQGDIIGKAQWPAILDEVTWRQIRKVLSRRTVRVSVQYPLTGLLRCAVCGNRLVGIPDKYARRYGCSKRQTGGCGGVIIKADHVEGFLYDKVLPVADAPVMRDVLRSEDKDMAKTAQELTVANAEDQEALDQISTDYYQDRVIDRATYLKQSQRIRQHIEARETQIASLRGRTALSRLGGDVQSGWDEMPTEDQRAILSSFIAHIEIGKASKPGSNLFDPSRVHIVWKSEQYGKVLVGMLGSKDRITWRKTA